MYSTDHSVADRQHLAAAAGSRTVASGFTGNFQRFWHFEDTERGGACGIGCVFCYAPRAPIGLQFFYRRSVERGTSRSGQLAHRLGPELARPNCKRVVELIATATSIMKAPQKLTPPNGKLAVFLPGLGAVATTFVAGCMLARTGKGLPIGSLTQMGTIRLGKRTDNRVPKISEFVPLAQLADLEFAAWDLFPDDAYE